MSTYPEEFSRLEKENKELRIICEKIYRQIELGAAPIIPEVALKEMGNEHIGITAPVLLELLQALKQT